MDRSQTFIRFSSGCFSWGLRLIVCPQVNQHPSSGSVRPFTAGCDERFSRGLRSLPLATLRSGSNEAALVASCFQSVHAVHVLTTLGVIVAGNCGGMKNGGCKVL